MVRIPLNARERNQWVIKRALDTGVYGLMWPEPAGIRRRRGPLASVGNILLIDIIEEDQGGWLGLAIPTILTCPRVGMCLEAFRSSQLLR
jgi:hypothetical protein